MNRPMHARILDLTPGRKGIWFDKNHPAVTFVSSLEDIPGGGYDLVVFDPPHLNVGAHSNMAKCYGHHTAAEIRAFVVRAAECAHKATSEGAFMEFKWNDHDTKLPSILQLIERWWEPLFGQKTATRTPRLNSTYWVMLLRRSLDSPT